VGWASNRKNHCWLAPNVRNAAFGKSYFYKSQCNPWNYIPENIKGAKTKLIYEKPFCV